MPRQRLWVRKLVIYGATNSGRDFSLDAQLLDQEAVVDHLGLDRFNLLGAAESGQVAVTDAVRHPARVALLVLWSG